MSIPSRERPAPPSEPDPGQALDDPVYSSLRGAHRGFAEVHGAAARYATDVSVFAALADPTDPSAWRDLATLVGPGAMTVLVGHDPATVPPGWTVPESIAGVQLVAETLQTGPDEEAVGLGPADVAEMLALVALTEPGPFEQRTVGLGTYLGIRREGRLVAMAGERLRPPGWTEISAVCTHPGYRGHGFATRLVRAVGDGIRARGETPMMHAAATNTNAIRLYESIGFRVRRPVDFTAVQAPGPS